MAERISGMARDELVQVVGERYRYGSRDTKVRVLDEFVAVTGDHRKHAIQMLNSAHAGQGAPTPRLRPRLYDEAVREALVVLWEETEACIAVTRPGPETPRPLEAS